jgi:hypothetical protein
MRQAGAQRINLRAAATCGWMGYTCRTDGQWSLIVRNFRVNPAGEYVDVPWTDAERLGLAAECGQLDRRFRTVIPAEPVAEGSHFL